MQKSGYAWTLWVAAAIAAVGGVAPFVFGGTSSRIDAVVVPFWIGAVVFAASAFLPNQSRGVTAILYFVGGLAIVYGLLSMFSLPVRLAALGTCPAPPARCTTGLPVPMTNGENTGLGVASTLGIIALFLGFFGLVTIYRRSAAAPSAPPVRTIPPVAPPPAAPAPEPAVATTPEEPVEAQPETRPAAPAQGEEDVPELPPHESSSSTP